MSKIFVNRFPPLFNHKQPTTFNSRQTNTKRPRRTQLTPSKSRHQLPAPISPNQQQTSAPAAPSNPSSSHPSPSPKQLTAPQAAKIPLAHTQGPLSPSPDTEHVADYDVLAKFPTELFDDLEEIDKHAALVAGASGDAVELLLSDIAESIAEITIETKNPKMFVVIVHGPDTIEVADKYHILKVKLKNGEEEYVLDLTSAKHGYPDLVVPWSEYLSTRVGKALATEGFGSTRDRLLERVEKPTIKGALVRINKQVVEAVGIALKKIEQGQGIRFFDLKKMVYFSFEQLAKDTATYTGIIIQSLLDLMKKSDEEKAKLMGGDVSLVKE
ncbi:uncharacterized protein PAC_15557 [Phialocephala subalpina]|uniref:Uncharacterized protein n=1 Tax=Phialocephala subalpina TaxID=576137 RepID=A0A1L7XL46_9HELO|nr:uncharacterized protein PAC_15557 [Phialocephala subalpina]